MRPVDQKLRYQIDKLVRTAVTGSLGANDPLQLRPRPENLISKLSESDDSEEEAVGKKNEEEDGGKREGASGRKYIPPKIAPMHYDGDVPEQERERRSAERVRRAALRSSVIQELREQYSSTPEEVRDRRDFQTDKESREELHKREYEESMMVRLNVTRKERIAKKRGLQGMSSQLNSITHFGNISALTGQESGNPRPKKKKTIKKKSKKRGNEINSLSSLWVHFQMGKDC
ncbi:NGDN protein, partial [Amia calva]|nr:NGDN protein [Amia calva]